MALKIVFKVATHNDIYCFYNYIDPRYFFDPLHSYSFINILNPSLNRAEGFYSVANDIVMNENETKILFVFVLLKQVGSPEAYIHILVVALLIH